jgi:hypothetical protein
MPMAVAKPGQGRSGQGRAGQGRAGPVAMCKGSSKQSLCPGTTNLYDAAISDTHVNRALNTCHCCVLLAVETVLNEPAAKQDLKTKAYSLLL